MYNVKEVDFNSYFLRLEYKVPLKLVGRKFKEKTMHALHRLFIVQYLLSQNEAFKRVNISTSSIFSETF